MEEVSYSSYQSYLHEQLHYIFNGKYGDTYKNNFLEMSRIVDPARVAFNNSNLTNSGILSEDRIWKKEPKIGYDSWYRCYDSGGNHVFDYEDDVRAVGDFHEGLAWVRIGYNHFKYTDKAGRYILDIGDVYNVGDFHNGHAWIVDSPKKFHFIDKKGNKSTIFEGAWDLHNGYFIVRNGLLYNVLNENFELIGDWSLRIPFVYISHNFEIVNNKVNVRENYLKDYYVRNKYQCVKEDKVINVKYQPVKVYYDRYVLCIDNSCKIYLYDENDNSYTKIDSAKWVEFDDNFIVSQNQFYGDERECSVAYFVYDGGIVDITDYYNYYLKDKDSFTITHGYGKLPTFNEYKNRDSKLMKEDVVGNILGEDTLHRRRF